LPVGKHAREIRDFGNPSAVVFAFDVNREIHGTKLKQASGI
jgi:hypothetical protein